MRHIPFVFTLFLVSGLLDSRAQAQALSREGMIPSSKRVINTEPVPNTPEWQLTLDVIKVKAGVLMDKNAQLTQERDVMMEQYRDVQLEMRDAQMKSEELRQVLQQRHGRSEQQTRLDEMKSLKQSKEAEVKGLQKNLSRIENDALMQERKVKLKKLKMTDMDIVSKTKVMHSSVKEEMQKRAVMSNDEELNQLKEKMQFEHDQEELLKTQLIEFKENPQGAMVTEVVTEEQLKGLEEKAQALRKQKEGLQKQANVDNSQAQMPRYLALMTKKKELEAKIKDSETQLEQLQEPEALGIWDPKQKKQLVRQLGQIDSRNAQVRQKIGGLKENAVLLREQISRLERKVSRKQEP